MLKNFKKIKRNSGAAMLISILFFLFISLAIVFGLVSPGVRGFQNASVDFKSKQSYFLAESGSEDAMYRLIHNMTIGSSETISLNSNSVTTTITDNGLGQKTVVALGDVSSYQRKVATTLNTGINVSFQYALQVGSGGLKMDNNSTVHGDMFSNGVVSGASAAVITGNTSVASGASATVDQEWLDNTGDFTFTNVATYSNVAQSFVPTVTDKITSLNIYLTKVSNPHDLNVIIVDDNNGVPSKNILVQKTIKASTIPTTANFVNLNFGNNPPTLTQNQKYWIVLDGTVDSHKYYKWGIDSTDDFPGNTGMYSNNWNAPSPVWTAAGGDFVFQTFMGSSTASLTMVSTGGNAYADNMQNCTVGGDAYYQTIGTCQVTGASHPGSPDPTPVSFPISDSLINVLETSSAAGGIITGPYTVNGSGSLGPKEINGNLIVNGTLTLTGNLWVKGTITFNTGASLKVSDSMLSNSAMIIADNTSNRTTSSTVNILNNVTMSGNSTPNNFIMIVSMNNDPKREGIELKNNLSSATTIFYAPHGYIDVHNNVTTSNLLAYRLHLHANTNVSYQAGSSSPTFPNSGLVLSTWQESK